MSYRDGPQAPPVGAPRFHQSYADGRRPPWDIDGPQPAVREIADEVSGSLLDVGCGTGQNALFFAARGVRVVGVDGVAAAIGKGRARAAERGLDARFEVGDALDLSGLGERFDHVLDCGLFHVFSDEERPRYARSLGTVVRPGSFLRIFVFSDLTPGTDGPRRVTQDEIRATFSDGWEVREVARRTFQTRMRDEEWQGGAQPIAWRATLVRTA